jgi:transposase InsO family protein
VECRGAVEEKSGLNRRHCRSAHVNDGAGVTLTQYANHAEAKADITDYIVGFYNCKRLNSALGNLSPSVYERKMAAREPIVVSEIT